VPAPDGTLMTNFRIVFRIDGSTRFAFGFVVDTGHALLIATRALYRP
jgi:hypothetical protein